MATAILGGKIYLSRDSFCEAVLIEDGIFTMVGTDQQVRAAAPAGCEIIDAGGRTVIPGINDSHMHLMNVGFSLSLCDMNGAKSIAEVVARGKKFLAENQSARDGFLCCGYNQDYFEDERRLLIRRDLDQISESVPVVVKRVCGHTVSANAAALQKARITASTVSAEGGEIGIGPDGQPNGIFSESAIDQVMTIFPEPSFARREEMMKRAMEYAVSVGLTSVQSNDAYEAEAGAHFLLMKKICDEGNLLLRYRHQITFTDEKLLEGYLAGEKNDPWYADKPVTLGPLKLFKDGSLGARTALMRRDYADDPGNRGVEALSPARFSALTQMAARGGMQVVTHAIGDAAIEETISHYEAANAGGENRLRHGVVHYQITDTALHARMAKSGILALVQPIFLHYDLHIAADRVGEALAKTSYAFATLQKLGVPVSYGSDAPVEDPNPFRGIYCAVTRKDLSGFPENGFFPEERVDIYDAVDRYTAGSAWAEFQENVKGRVAPGYYADLVVLDRDIFTVPVEEIPGTKAEITMVGGKIVYRR
jgi:predicted amidohydrolase YtcJ